MLSVFLYPPGNIFRTLISSSDSCWWWCLHDTHIQEFHIGPDLRCFPGTLFCHPLQQISTNITLPWHSTSPLAIVCHDVYNLNLTK